MFPIPWNKAYRKKDGTLVNIDDAMGGGGSTIPIATAETLGGIKIGSGINITAEGVASVEPVDPDYGAYNSYVLGYALFKPATNGYNVGVLHDQVTASSGRTFGSQVFTLNEAFRPDLFDTLEFYNYLTDDVISGLDLELLYDGIESAVETAELAHPITDYDILVLQGCYSATQTSEYNTTLFYVNPDITKTYWFGVKDRNNQYSGILSFTDSTHVSLSVSRRIKIYGIKFE